MNVEDIKKYCIEKHKAEETYPFGDVPICYKLNGKIFAQVYPYEWDYKITLKCTKDMGEFYRMVYPEKVVRGYHCPPVQQPYWNTIYLSDFPDDELLNMIDHAYETVFNSFSKKIQKQIMEVVRMNIYEKCPTLESEKFVIRLFKDEDVDDLLKVYSDKLALPFFNSDNCDGDNFYYSTKERMADAIGFWHMAYENGWFVRMSIVDKAIEGVIGTVELCVRVSEDAFDNMGILRVDVRSDYEQENTLYDIFALVTPKLEEMLGCKGVLTKAPIYAVDRVKAIQKVGFTKSEHMLIGKTGYAYDGYWTIG